MTLAELLDPLLQPAFVVGGVPTNWAEFLGFVTGILTVWLVARQHLWNWPISVANVILLGLVFLAVGLYADAALQILYVALRLYGWWQWLYGGAGRTRAGGPQDRSHRMGRADRPRPRRHRRAHRCPQPPGPTRPCPSGTP